MKSQRRRELDVAPAQNFFLPCGFQQQGERQQKQQHAGAAGQNLEKKRAQSKERGRLAGRLPRGDQPQQRQSGKREQQPVRHPPFADIGKADQQQKRRRAETAKQRNEKDQRHASIIPDGRLFVPARLCNKCHVLYADPRRPAGRTSQEETENLPSAIEKGSSMSTYVIGDIHGEYDLFLQLLDKIKLRDQDTLYLMGDVLDRGPHPLKALLKLMEMPNAFCLLGNHEWMALECLPFLMEEITEEAAERLGEKQIKALASWMQNGCGTTLEEFRKLDRETQEEVLDYLKDLLLYAEVEAGGKRFFLVHAGLNDYAPQKPIEAYSLFDLIWKRADYSRRIIPDKTLVSGHTPTQTITENPRPGFVYRGNGHLAVDCGAGFTGGRLAAVCLESGEEFYAEKE